MLLKIILSIFAKIIVGLNFSVIYKYWNGVYYNLCWCTSTFSFNSPQTSCDTTCSSKDGENITVVEVIILESTDQYFPIYD